MVLWKSLRLNKKSQKLSNPLTRSFRVVEGTIPQALPVPAWGIDPGVNFGLTMIEGDTVRVFYGALLRSDEPGQYGEVAYNFIRGLAIASDAFHAHLIIEGAAYGAPFRQVELSEIRTGFYLGSSASGRFSSIEIKPPATIRKEVFGSGNVHAADEYPLLNHNGADSLAMALFAAERSMQKE